MKRFIEARTEDDRFYPAELEAMTDMETSTGFDRWARSLAQRAAEIEAERGRTRLALAA